MLSNVYLDKLDKELKRRGLHFVRYADECDIYVRSEMAADRVMKSLTDWFERKLRLKVSATKMKVVRPTMSVFSGIHVLEGQGRLETETGCRPQSEAHGEDA